MIWWPLVKNHEFILIDGPESIQNIQLTKGFVIKSRYVPYGQMSKMKIEIYINGKLESQLTQFWEAAIVDITRKGSLIIVEINGKWKQTYYLKTPIIWKTKKL